MAAVSTVAQGTLSCVSFLQKPQRQLVSHSTCSPCSARASVGAHFQQHSNSSIAFFSKYADTRHFSLRSLSSSSYSGRRLGFHRRDAVAQNACKQLRVLAKAGGKKKRTQKNHSTRTEDFEDIPTQKSNMLEFTAPESKAGRGGTEKFGVQELDEDWDEWDTEAIALDGEGGRKAGLSGLVALFGNGTPALGNGAPDAAVDVKNPNFVAAGEEALVRNDASMSAGNGVADSAAEDEWESLSEEEEAALLSELEKAPGIEIVSLAVEGESEGGVEAETEDWRPVPDEEKQLLQEQLETGEDAPLIIERVSDDGEAAPVGRDEAEGLGVLWDAPGPMQIERISEGESGALGEEEVEQLQRLWDTVESPSGSESGAEAGFRPDEVPGSGEKWEDFGEEQLLRVQSQLDAFKEQFAVDEDEDFDSEDEEELREDVWAGDLEGEMTPEEEAELLREAELDLAQGFRVLEEDVDAELVQRLNETSNFRAQGGEGEHGVSDDEEARLIREAEIELSELSAGLQSGWDSADDWEDEDDEELTADEVLIRVLNQERSAELELSDVDEEDESDNEESEDVWVGDLDGDLSPEEEAELLAAAERELALLRSQSGGSENGGASAQNGVLDGGLESDIVVLDEDSVRQKMAESLRALVDESSPKRKKKSAGKSAPPLVREKVESSNLDEELEVGPMSKLQEARMLKRMDKELHDLRKDDREVEYDEEGREKKKIPMEMRCFDTAKIFVRAGDGGNGCVAFRREKFVAYGGPSGGNGGRGGHVFVEVDQGMNSLQPFRKQIHFRAGRGGHGEGSKCEGPKGEDITIKVPPGTVVKRAKEVGEEEGEWLMELVKPGEKQVLIPGGRGGRGNTSFKSSQNKAPVIAENGEEGPEMWIELELKLVADVGIVGVPNAGKSTLLSVISAARPKIANYPFTTLVPNLGVVEIDYETIVFADVPGLLEGAHTGHGLGQEFLRHCERSRVLVHMIDGTSPQPVYDYEAICNEMALFNPILAQKPQIVVFNKMDLPESQEAWPAFQKAMQERGVEPVAISAVAQENVTAVLRQTQALLKKIANPYEFDPFDQPERRVKVLVPANNKGPPIDVFNIEEDPHTRTWMIMGDGLERFTQMTNWEYYEAVKRFQKVLDASGVNQELKKRGVREGDTVVLGEMEFAWIDKDDWNTFGDGWTRGTRGSKHWPH